MRERDGVSEPDEPGGHPGQGDHHRRTHALALVRMSDSVLIRILWEDIKYR